jgi:hypothetical protein
VLNCCRDNEHLDEESIEKLSKEMIKINPFHLKKEELIGELS